MAQKAGRAFLIAYNVLFTKQFKINPQKFFYSKKNIIFVALKLHISQPCN